MLFYETVMKKIFRNQFRKPNQAQSMVEFAIALPILILLLTGMVEFGFMLNTYLSIQDAARSTARRYSTINPFDATGSVDPNFFVGAAEYAIDLLAPAGDPNTRQIVMESDRDNILVSLVCVEVDESQNPDSISLIKRYSSGGEYYKHFSFTNPATGYQDSAITSLLTNGAEPSDAGLVVIEIYYGYEGTLNLPWTIPFFSPGNPSMLYVSVVMPTIYTKPPDSTSCP